MHMNCRIFPLDEREAIIHRVLSVIEGGSCQITTILSIPESVIWDALADPLYDMNV